jgi:hypothetical protein
VTAREEPEQSYFPSCRVRLIIRLEDFGKSNVPAPPLKPSTARSGTRDKKAASLQVLERNGALLLAGPGDDLDELGTPHDQQSSSDDLTHVVDGIVPVTAQFLRNGLRTADTATIEIAHADLPLDGRAIRAIGVQLFMGTVSPEDYSRGQLGELRDSSSTISGVRVPYNVLPDSYVDPYGRPRTNKRFEGWVDEWESDFPDSDANTVTLQCTDNTRLLIGQEAGAKLAVGVDKPIDRAVAEYLANYPQFRGLSVQYRPAVASGQIPALKTALQKTKFQPKLGPAPAGGGSSQKLMVWDYLTDVVGSIAHTIRVEDSTIIIQRARTIYDSSLPGRPDDPFTGRVLPSGLELKRRLYAFGRNIKQGKFTRKFAKVAGVNIEVRSYDPTRKKTLVQRFPQKGDRVTSHQPGNASDQKWRVITVSGIKDEKILRALGQGIYEQINRNELITRVVTQNLGSYGGGNADPDALDAYAGDPIDVRVIGETDDGNTMVERYNAVATRGATFLKSLGYSDRFARAYQKTIDNIGLQSTFKVKTMGGQWDSQSSGITLDFELMNYVEVRADKILPAGEEITSSQAQGGESVRVKVEGST